MCLFVFRLRRLQYEVVTIDHSVNWNSLLHYLDSPNGRDDLKSIESDNNCVIKITASSETSLSSRKLGGRDVQKDVCFTVNKTKIVVRNMDITESGVKVLVIPTTSNLDVVGGVRRAALEKGKFASQIVAEIKPV